MSMKEYKARVAFTLSVTNPVHSNGVPVKAGDTLSFDGYNVSFKGLNDVAPSLNAAIREKWLVEVGVSTPAAPAAPDYMTSPIKVKAAESLVQKASVDSGAGDNGSVSSTSSTISRGREVLDMEGSVVKKTNYNNEKTEAAPARKKMGFVRDNDQNQVVGTVSTSREMRVLKSTEGGDVIISSKRAKVAKESFEVTSDADSREVSKVYEGRRKVPAKQGPMEVNDSIPLSDRAADKAIYKQAGIDNGDTEGPGAASAETDTGDTETPAHDTGTPVEMMAVSASARTKKNSVGVTVNVVEELKAVEAKLPKVTQKTFSSNPGVFESHKPLEATVPELNVELPPAPQVAPAAPEAKDAVTSLSIEGIPWDSVGYEGKAEYVKTLSDVNLLKAINIHKRSHWMVRKAAKERMLQLAK